METQQLAIKTNYVREHNIKLITSLLYAEQLSCLELSKKIGISDVGVRKIIKELETGNIVRRASVENAVKTKGNQHIRYKLNSDLGMFLIIEFTHMKEQFVLYDFAGNKLYAERFFPPDVYTDERELYELTDLIKERIKAQGLSERKILNVTVSVIGQVDENERCFVISGRFGMFENDKEGRIYKIFEEAFNAPVTMKNNVTFMAIGESEAGFAGDYGMALFIFAGHGIAASVLYQGKPLAGWRGYAGEIGGNKFGFDSTLSLNCSIMRIMQKCAPYLKAQNFEELLEAYHKNEEVKKIVLNGARVLACEIGNISNLLGIDVVMIHGESLEFGEEYLNLLTEEVRRRSIPKAKIVLAKLQDPVMEGALAVAKEKAIEGIIKGRYEQSDN